MCSTREKHSQVEVAVALTQHAEPTNRVVDRPELIKPTIEEVLCRDDPMASAMTSDVIPAAQAVYRCENCHKPPFARSAKPCLR
jgi:hypothetical protein